MVAVEDARGVALGGRDRTRVVEELSELVDRNCHKSILHAITMTGAVPVFLMPTRNHFGIIGPIPREEFRWENIERKIRENPFARNFKGKPRVLTLTQSTYDGILYNVETI